MLDGQRARLERIYPARSRRSLRVVLRQGINRQIRRMFYEVGYEVKRLVRTRIGNLRLGDLPRGHWRPLTSAELRVTRSGVETPLARAARKTSALSDAVTLTPLLRAESPAAACCRCRGS